MYAHPFQFPALVLVQAAEEEALIKQREQEEKVAAARMELQRLQQKSEEQQQKVKNETARIESKYNEAFQWFDVSADSNRQRLMTVSG